MYLTGRQAADLLATVGLSRRQARRVLDAGLAGDPVVTRAAHLFREERLQELVGRPLVTMEQLDRACPSLLFFARRQVDARASRAQQLAVAGRRWQIGLTVSVVIRVEARRTGFVPFVATVGGFIALGADITGVVKSGPGIERDLILEEPGEWFDSLRGHRLPSSPGRDFFLHGWPPRRPSPDASAPDDPDRPGRAAMRGAAMEESAHPTPEENA